MRKSTIAGGKFKGNFKVELVLVKFGCQVADATDCKMKMEWKCGSVVEETPEYDINDIEVDIEANYHITYICPFNSKDGKNFDSKTCEFRFIIIYEGQNEKEIARIKGINMGAFCNKESAT